MRIRYSLERLDSGQPRRDLTAGRYRIGRDGDSDIVVEAQGVSRAHAELLICADRGIVVRDLGSTNGTRIEGRRIDEFAASGDVDIAIGSARLRLTEREGGLDALAYTRPAVGQADAADCATSSPTASVDLGRELRAIAARLRPPDGWSAAALSLLLAAWAERLGIARIRLVDEGDAVWACAGSAQDDGLMPIVAGSGWRLEADALGASAQRALAAIAEDMMLFCALPGSGASAAPSRSASAIDGPGLPSASPAMQEALRQLQRAARSTIPVLLLGETGVGKELVAHWLHRSSSRSHGPFLALNCAALPKDLLEAELFGVEKGAATGVSERPGLLEQAHGGTLFLDEIGDTPADTQVRLLRVLEDGRITRVGGRRIVDVDVRIVAATNRDLQGAIDAGAFRLDLYHRLAGFSATIPPLRERVEDVAPLAAHFFERALDRQGRRSSGITRAALLALQRHRWPGNVRELRQAIERGVTVLDEGEALDRVHLPETLRTVPCTADDLRLEAVLARAEREAMVTALALSGGQHDAAWQLLGIGKTSFYKKLRECGLGRSPEPHDNGGAS